MTGRPTGLTWYGDWYGNARRQYGFITWIADANPGAWYAMTVAPTKRIGHFDTRDAAKGEVEVAVMEIANG